MHPLFPVRNISSKDIVCLQFPGVLEGLESSGRLTGFVSIRPDTSPTSGCRLMIKTGLLTDLFSVDGNVFTSQSVNTLLVGS